MGEWHEFVRLRQFSNHYRLLLGTFGADRGAGSMVAVGGRSGAVVPAVRAAHGDAVSRHTLAQDGPAQLAWTLHGVLFFGATARLDELEDAINQAPQGVQVLLDLSDLLSLDTTSVDALEQLLKAAEQSGGRLRIRGAQPQVQSLLERSGLAAWTGGPSPRHRPMRGQRTPPALQGRPCAVALALGRQFHGSRARQRTLKTRAGGTTRRRCWP